MKFASLKLQLSQVKEASGGTDCNNIRAIENMLQHAIVQEEKFWAQKGHQSWIRLGENNTGYFHAVVSQRRRNNQIRGLLDYNCLWVSSH
ncbi:conserved hypothetical protein [Ricinus communis]|uniref:Uncharacterized protein n=1 Tax=Ricinus communis TaxID=3988 RepID=B9RNN9_RICCO|nr:conserved hypothetical protein [Ricinus communis]